LPDVLLLALAVLAGASLVAVVLCFALLGMVVLRSYGSDCCWRDQEDANQPISRATS
jgi:hypothetical protein